MRSSHHIIGNWNSR